MATNVLLSIKPVFAKLIFSGEKRYEFRKTLFREPTVKKVVVYASAPISMIIGEFTIDSILEQEPETLWSMTNQYAGITKAFFDSYFAGRSRAFAIKVKTTFLYDQPLELERMSIRQAPQSFVYIPRYTAAPA